VLNEADSLPRLLEGLAAQTRPPDEVVVCDGGSSDGTLSILQAEARLPLRAISRPGLNISQGRNAAIEAATGDVIAVTDAGVRLSPQWLEQITAPFADDATAAVAGFFRPDPTSVFETAMGATVLPELRDIDTSGGPLAAIRSGWTTVRTWSSICGCASGTGPSSSRPKRSSTSGRAPACEPSSCSITATRGATARRTCGASGMPHATWPIC